MCRFIQPRTEYFDFLNHLYNRYSRYLEDDYNKDTIAGIISRTYPFFWVITENNSSKIPAGFVYLENITGNNEKLHGAEITTCFHPDFWGDFPKYCAKIFLKRCFDKFGFQKIKAVVYPHNCRVKMLLKSAGFKKEALLKSETMKNGQLQDIEIYSVYKTDYEVKNEN